MSNAEQRSAADRNRDGRIARRIWIPVYGAAMLASWIFAVRKGTGSALATAAWVTIVGVVLWRKSRKEAPDER